jgi:hypothetical protein
LFHYRYANTHTLISPSKQRAAKKEGDTKQKQVCETFYVKRKLRGKMQPYLFGLSRVSETLQISYHKTALDQVMILKNIMKKFCGGMCQNVLLLLASVPFHTDHSLMELSPS